MQKKQLTDLNFFFTQILSKTDELYPENTKPLHVPVLVHSSLSAFGYIEGGAETLLTALIATCKKYNITLVMPAHSDGTDTEESEVYDTALSSCKKMGIVSETFRTMKGVSRSAHPHLSFCAKGALSQKIIRKHKCETGLGQESPLEKLYQMNSLVLMLGTGYDTCTALHLAEYAQAKTIERNGGSADRVTCYASIKQHNALNFWRRENISYKMWEDIAFHPENFPFIGRDFEKQHGEKIIQGMITEGHPYRLFTMRDIVNFSIDSKKFLE